MERDLLYVNWRSDSARRIFTVGRLLHRADEPRWEFSYVEESREAKKHGFMPFPEFSDLEMVYRSAELFPLFELRLMSASRGDFPAYVERLGLVPQERDPMVILARSGGRSATDRIELISPPRFEATTDRHICHFFARGIRYEPEAEPAIAQLAVGDELRWSEEPRHPHDPLAIALFIAPAPSLTGDTLVGRVPFYLVEGLERSGSERVDLRVFVEKVNLFPSPVDQRLLCRLEAKWSDGFMPFSSSRFRSRSPAATWLQGSAASTKP